MSIEHYFRSSSMDWFKEDKKSRYSPFHWHETELQTLKAGEAVLEVCQNSINPIIGIIGFGFGRETELLFNQGVKAKVIALDINHTRFDEAKIIRPNLFTDQINPVTASMNNTPFVTDAFDATLCLETMMHSDNPKLTLMELTRITKPNGIIIFNMSTSLGMIYNFIQMLNIEGLPRVVKRFKERMLQDTDSSSTRTKLCTPEQIDDLIHNNKQTRVIEISNYLKGLSTFIILKKII